MNFRASIAGNEQRVRGQDLDKRTHQLCQPQHFGLVQCRANRLPGLPNHLRSDPVEAAERYTASSLNGRGRAKFLCTTHGVAAHLRAPVARLGPAQAP